MSDSGPEAGVDGDPRVNGVPRADSSRVEGLPRVDAGGLERRLLRGPRRWRRRERETARRLRALQEQVRRTPVPDSPVEDDAAPPAVPAPPARSESDGDSPEGARILPFPPRP